MKKIKFIGILFVLLLCSNVKAWTGDWCEFGTKSLNPLTDSVDEIIKVNTFRETTNPDDEYLTIERNSTIIGKTRFTPDEIITASKASAAGYDYAILKAAGDHHGLDYNSYPEIYVYYGEVGGWYKLGKDNSATSVTDATNLSTQDIYAINNVKKGQQVYFKAANGNPVYNTDPIEALGDIDTICQDLGIYTVLESKDNSALITYYVSSYADGINLFVNKERTQMYKLVRNTEKSSYDIDIRKIVIEDLDESVTNQKNVFVKDFYNENISEKVIINYINGNSEYVVIPAEGLLIPNMDSIDSIQFPKEYVVE